MDTQDNQFSSNPEQPQAAPVAESSSNPQSKSRSWLVMALLAALALLFAALIPIAYIMGKQSVVTDVSTNSSTSTSQDSGEKSEEEIIEETMDDISGTYNGWVTFTNKTYDYSFKYPSGWKVKNTSSSETGNRVSVNPPGEADSGNGDVLALSTYADGVGCPSTKTKEFNVGEYTVEGVACEDSEVYKIAMKYSRVASNGSQGVVLARAAPNALSIQIDMSRGEDEALRLILESVTGLSPAS